MCFGTLRNLQQWLDRAKKRNDWLWSGKSPYFTLSFSFQINISVKIRAGLLRSLRGNLDERFVSDQLSSLDEDVPAMSNLFAPKISNYNRLDTKGKLLLPKPRTDYLNCSFSQSAALQWNNPPEEVRKANSLDVVKRRIHS